MDFIEKINENAKRLNESERRRIFDRYYPFMVTGFNLIIIISYIEFRYLEMGMPKPISDVIKNIIGINTIEYAGLIIGTITMILSFYVLIRTHGFHWVGGKTGFFSYARKKNPIVSYIFIIIILIGELLFRTW